MNLTTKQLCYIFDLAGIHYEQPEETQMSDEWVVEEGQIKGEGDNEDYKGLICYSQEYPEEGAVALED